MGWKKFTPYLSSNRTCNYLIKGFTCGPWLRPGLLNTWTSRLLERTGLRADSLKMAFLTKYSECDIYLGQKPSPWGVGMLLPWDWHAYTCSRCIHRSPTPTAAVHRRLMTNWSSQREWQQFLESLFVCVFHRNYYIYWRRRQLLIGVSIAWTCWR